MSNSNWQRAAIEQLAAGSRVAGTVRGPVEYAEIGQGPAVLALHGRPGGYDQGLVMARSLGEDLARWIAVSRPGYLRTPLETGPTPAEQADAYAALLDTIGIGQAVVVGLSGGGPSGAPVCLVPFRSLPGPGSRLGRQPAQAAERAHTRPKILRFSDRPVRPAGVVFVPAVRPDRGRHGPAGPRHRARPARDAARGGPP